MEFSLGRDTLPSQARSVRGESRRLRRERDNAKKLFPDVLLWRIAQRDCAVAIMRPVFGANWRTAADVKSVHDHLSRHHAGPKIERARFDIGLGIAGIGLHAPADMPAVKTGNRRREPAALPPPPSPTAAGLAVRIISMAVRDHASLVTHRNRNLASTTVINSSQRRTCATMLTLTSHYWQRTRNTLDTLRACSHGWQLTVIGGGVTAVRKGLPRIRKVALGCAAALVASGTAFGVRGPAVIAAPEGFGLGSGGGGRDGGVGAYG